MCQGPIFVKYGECGEELKKWLIEVYVAPSQGFEESPEVVKQPESPKILGTILPNNHYPQNPNPSFHQMPNNQIFPFFQPMPYNPYPQYSFHNPFHTPHSAYMPPAVSPMTPPAARTVQSATQNEVVKQPESPNFLGTILPNNHYSQNPNPSFHQMPNNQIFPFFQPMPFNPYSQYFFHNPFHNPPNPYMPPAVSPMTPPTVSSTTVSSTNIDTEYIDSLYKDNQFEDDYVKPPSYYWAEPGK